MAHAHRYHRYALYAGSAQETGTQQVYTKLFLKDVSKYHFGLIEMIQLDFYRSFILFVLDFSVNLPI